MRGYVGILGMLGCLGRTYRSSQEMIQKAPFLELEYRRAQEPKPLDPPSHSLAGPVYWNPPPAGWMKVNTNAAISRTTSSTGLGVALRDSSGTVKWAMSDRLLGCKPPLVVEALAMRVAIDAGAVG